MGCVSIATKLEFILTKYHNENYKLSHLLIDTVFAGSTAGNGVIIIFNMKKLDGGDFKVIEMITKELKEKFKSRCKNYVADSMVGSTSLAQASSFCKNR